MTQADRQGQGRRLWTPPGPGGPGPANTRLDAQAIVTLTGLCALWGLQGVSVKLGIAGGLPPIQQAAARSAIAILCLVAWTARSGPGALRTLLPRPGAWGAAILIGAVFGAEFALLNLGLRRTTASLAVLLLYTAPFFVLAGAVLTLGERLRLRQLIGIGVAFGGVAIAFAHGLQRGGGSLPGDALCLLAAMLWAANTVLVKALAPLRRAGAAAVLAWQLALSLPWLIAASLVAGEPQHWPDATATAWLALAYQGVVVAFASYLAWFWLVLRYPAGRLSGFTFSAPMFGVAAGAAVLGEPVGLALPAGVIAIACGLRLVNG